MIGSDLSALAKNRDALLLAEVAMWLHMPGKYHEEFLGKNHRLDVKIPKDLSDNFPQLSELLTDGWPARLWEKIPLSDSGKGSLSFYSFIKNHRDREKAKKHANLIKLAIDAHGRGSGSEKGVLRRESYEKQDGGTVYLSTAFGYEVNPIDLDALGSRKEKLYGYLKDQLDLLKASLDLEGKNTWGVENWLHWRQPFLKRLKDDFITSVGDTRRPVNDVSLWDQIAASVAFFKTELAEVFLKKWKDPFENGEQYKYKTLRVSLQGIEFLSQSSRIPDVLARRTLIEKGSELIKNVIEIEYPLGLEIYRDAGRILFLVPEIDGLQDYRVKNGIPLKDYLQEKFNAVSDHEIELDITLSSGSSRNVFFSGKEISEQVRPLTPSFAYLKKIWENRQEARCEICHVRPLGFGAEDRGGSYSQKARERNMCCVCLGRLEGSSENGETVWIDEVADANGRIALIAARFDLGRWLNGEMISTFRNLKECGVTYKNILEEFKVMEEPGKKLEKLEKYSKIAETYAQKKHGETLGGLTIYGLYKLIVKDDDLGEAYPSLSENEKLALAVWRKTPSFARVRRVWESTQAFWEDIRQEFRHYKVDYRLKIIGSFTSIDNNTSLALFNPYEAENNGTKFGIFTNENKELLIIENLHYLAKKIGVLPQQIETRKELVSFFSEEFCTGKTLNIYQPEEKKGDKLIGTLEITHVCPEETPYLPAITILVEPDRFMAIVPAEKAMEISTLIKEKYEKEMAKVRNRLPVSLGVVFARSHIPLVALMDAGRRMINQPLEQQRWVLKSDVKIDGDSYAICFDNGITWEIPVKMGDGKTEDIWYPYFYVEGVPGDRLTAFKGLNSGAWLVHVKELKKGDVVSIFPSKFDFEFLGSTSLRFEISYNLEGKRRELKNKTSRPYLLEKIEYFKDVWLLLIKKLERSQIKSIIEIIEAKREEWNVNEDDEVFKNFVHNVLQNAHWENGPPPEISNLEMMAVNGELRDIVELYMNVLKVKPARGNHSKEAQA
ncbi:MAG: CRISPR-associated protein Csx11 [Dethiobacter sp.]|jgi:CRISPR-associated Csx11 family protein|nr:MAG: CRISPR-associated protein Csx11 [Dethiobacter sp.]